MDDNTFDAFQLGFFIGAVIGVNSNSFAVVANLLEKLLT